MTPKKYLKEAIKFGDKELVVETGRVAKQADGSVVISYGETMLLVTAVSSRSAAKGWIFSR
jgi:polyribonucleotide nucleotidyltransferase